MVPKNFQPTIKVTVPISELRNHVVPGLIDRDPDFLVVPDTESHTLTYTPPLITKTTVFLNPSLEVVAAVVFGFYTNDVMYSSMTAVNYFLYKNCGLIGRSDNKAPQSAKMVGVGIRDPRGGPGVFGEYDHTTRLNNSAVMKKKWPAARLQALGAAAANTEKNNAFPMDHDGFHKMEKLQLSQCVGIGAGTMFGTPATSKFITSNYISNMHRDKEDITSSWIAWYEAKCTSNADDLVEGEQRINGRMETTYSSPGIEPILRGNRATSTGESPQVESYFRIGDFCRFRIQGNLAVYLNPATMAHGTFTVPVAEDCTVRIIGTAVIQSMRVIERLTGNYRQVQNDEKNEKAERMRRKREEKKQGEIATEGANAKKNKGMG